MHMLSLKATLLNEMKTSLRAFSFVGRRCEEACTLVFLSRTLSAKINQRLVSTEDLRYSASLQIVKHRFN